LYGKYQESISVDKNIGMPDSLLSRFDLVFVIKDEESRARDGEIAERVLRNHMMGRILEVERVAEGDDEWSARPMI
jgi:DNA replicative helicase MCM subunit Mcm2 (Cdc46/Mcm family)